MTRSDAGLRAQKMHIAMQEHFGKKGGEKRKSSRACQSDLLKAAGLARITLYYQLSLQKAKDKYADVNQLIASIFAGSPDPL